MSGISKVKMLAAIIVAVLAVCAVSIAFMAPSDTDTKDIAITPETPVFSSESVPQSGSLEYLMKALDLCYFYVDSVETGGARDFKYVFGDGCKDGKTYTVGVDKVDGNILLNDGAVVDFTFCDELVMDGKILCANGQNVQFVNNNTGDRTFSIIVKNDGYFMLGANIRLAVSSTLEATPFTIDYTGENNIFDENHNPLSTLTVNGSFSVNLDDSVQNGFLTLDHKRKQGSLGDMSYEYTNINYYFSGRIGKEIEVTLDYDFTDYYNFISEENPDGTPKNIPMELTISDWINYFFYDQYVVPEGSASLYMNGLTLDYEYKNYKYCGSDLLGFPLFSYRGGHFDDMTIDQLTAGIESYNKTDSDPKNGTIYASAQSIKYDHGYLEDTRYLAGKQVGYPTDNTESVDIQNFSMELNVDTSSNGTTTIDLYAHKFCIDIDYVSETESRTVYLTINELDICSQFNKSDIDDLYQFMVDILHGDDVMGTLMNADYSVILCDAVIDLSCDELSVNYTYAIHDLDSKGTRGYTPYSSSGMIYADTVSFNCNYAGSSETSNAHISKLSVDHDTDYRSMVQIPSGKYLASKQGVSTDVDIDNFTAEASLKLTDLSTVIGYVVTVIAGGDVSDVNLRGISITVNATSITTDTSDELRYMAIIEYNTPKWDPGIKDEYITKEISKSQTYIEVSNFYLDEDIKNIGREVGLIRFDDVEMSTQIYYPEDGIDTNVTLDAGLYDVYCSIDSDEPKMIRMIVALMDCFTSEDAINGLEGFIQEFIFDGTNIAMTVSLDKAYMDYDTSISMTSGDVKTVIASDVLDLIVGKDVPTVDEEKTVSVSFDLNAGNKASKIGYHDSFISVSMGSEGRAHYLLESEYYQTNYVQSGNELKEMTTLETSSNEYDLTGVNGIVSIDSMVYIDGTIVREFVRAETSSEPIVGATYGSSTEFEIESNNTVLDLDIEYDKVNNLRAFITECMKSEEPIALMMTQEFDELLDGLYIHSTSGKQRYQVATELTGSISLTDSSTYVADDYELCVDYLYNHFISFKTSHISLATASSENDGKTTDSTSVNVDLYDLYLKVDTELAGLNDFITYAMTFLSTGDLDTPVIEDFEMTIEVDIVGRADQNEYVMIHTITSNGSSNPSYKEERTLNFLTISLDVVVGTSGTEQVVMVSDGLAFKDTITSGSSILDTDISINYIELSFGTDSKSLYKFVAGMYASFGDPEVESTQGDVISAFITFISDSSNTKFYFKISSGEFCITNQNGALDSIYKISVPASKTDRFALMAEGSLKISCDDDLNFTMAGTYVKLNSADDSKITYSNSYGGNEYIEYFEFQNLDMSLRISADIGLSNVYRYIGDQEQIMRFITDSISVKGVITADSGKYTSSRIHSDLSSYKIQIRSDAEMMIKIDSTIYKLYSSDSVTQALCMEGTIGNIVSEYTDDNYESIREVFDFTQFKVYLAGGRFTIELPSVTAQITINGETYGMTTDGTTYYDSTIPSLGGFSIYVNGVLMQEDGYGLGPTIKVDTFTVNGDSVLYAGRTFIKGTEIELTEQPNAPSNFAGWKVNNVMVPRTIGGGSVYYAPMDDNITITYVYGYILTYDTKGGSQVNQIMLNVGDEIDLSITPVKDGCTFVKWDSPYTVMPAFNLTVTAMWAPNSYVLTVDYDNGSQKKETSVVYGDAITMSITPTREGYTFAGWLGYTDKMVMPAHDLTIKALWSKTVTDSSLSVSDLGTKVDIDADIADMSKDILDKMISLSESSKTDLKMNFSGATISMSSGSLKKLARDEITGKSSDMKLSVTKSQVVSESILKTVDSKDLDVFKNVKYAISIDVVTDGCTSGLGTVTVAVPVDDIYLGSIFIVYYVSTEGDVTPISAVCEKVNGQACVVFETDHFSYFALSEAGLASPSSNESSGMSPLIYVAIGVACLLVIGIIVFVVLKRRYII